MTTVPISQRAPVRAWVGFLPFALLSLVHVVALAVPADAVAGPTKLGLMPLLGLGVVLTARGTAFAQATRRRARGLLLAAIALSWLGDGAGAFFPFAPTIPVMLGFFGLAHVAYIVLLWRFVARRRPPRWAFVFGLWWVALVVVLWPSLGALAVPTAVYGLVLAGTAVAASRCSALIAVGAVLFLTSDTILAFRLFTPDAMPDWTSPAVMLTYCLGQGLIAVGVVRELVAPEPTSPQREG